MNKHSQYCFCAECTPLTAADEKAINALIEIHRKAFLALVPAKKAA